MRTAILALLALACATAGIAQERKLTVQNLAPAARKGWARVVVPFKQGEVKGTPEFSVKDTATVWHPFGARYRDGSVRQALCLFPVELRGMSEVAFELVKGKGPEKEHGKKPELPEEMAMVVQLGDTKVRGVPKLARVFEDNAARRVELRRCRVGTTGLVYELIVASYAGREHFDVSVGVFFSDWNTKDMMRSVNRITIETKEWKLFLRNARRTGVRYEKTDKGSRVVLLEKNHFGDGQGIRRCGVLVPEVKPDDRSLRADTIRAAKTCPILGATKWTGTGAWGPFGIVPDPPAWLRGRLMRNAMGRRHGAFVKASNQPGRPFDNFGLILTKNPGRSGYQDDFGIVKMTPVVATGLPSFLLEAEMATLQEACRPVHFFKPDGSMLLAKERPEWVTWDGRTHWHNKQSPDRLGKPHPEPKHDRHGWDGKDRQHWSTNHLCGYYLLTAEYWALREIEQEIQLFMSGQTIRPDRYTSGPDAPRAAGRCLLAGCWMYLCTGDEVLRKRMEDRIEKSYMPAWIGRQWTKDRMRVLQIRDPEGRALGKGIHFWAPWQESMAAVGFAALHRLTGNKGALELAKGISDTCVRHAWEITAKGPRIAYCIAWKDGGIAPGPTERSNKDVFRWAGGGIAAWSLGAVALAEIYAKQDGDKAMAERARRILEGARRLRRPPRDGWFDDFGDWDCIR